MNTVVLLLSKLCKQQVAAATLLQGYESSSGMSKHHLHPIPEKRRHERDRDWIEKYAASDIRGTAAPGDSKVPSSCQTEILSMSMLRYTYSPCDSYVPISDDV